ncbi:MAG: GAF domain-containing protein [Anaerolineales bacterium]|nr:GAF domain-containing protein [Anaerolineales bacterium]
MNPKKQGHSTISREPELTVLNTLISATHTWTDTQAVLSVALEQVAKLAKSDGAECHLANSAGELEFTAQYNLDPDFVSESLKLRILSGTGIPGRAYASQSAIHVPDIAAEERYLRREPARRAGYHSLICIPLTGLDTLLGTFTLYYKQEIQPATDLQIILTTVGKQMGIAVERAHLFQKTAKQLKELQVLQTVSNALNRSANIQEALEHSLEAVITAMNMPCGWVVLLDGFQKVRLAASYNLPPKLNPADWAALQAPCHCLDLLQQGRLDSAVNIVECQQLKKVTDPQHPYLSHVSIPIRTGNLLLGNLNLVPPPDSTFTEENLRMFTAIGDQIGVAIERALLYEESKEQRIREQQILLGHGRMLLGEHNLQTIMDQTMMVVTGALQVEHAVLALVDPDGKTYSARAGVGWSPERIRRINCVPIDGKTPICQAIRTKMPVIISDIIQEENLKIQIIHKEASLVSSLVIPMIINEKTLGGIAVHAQIARKWNEDEIRLLSLLADQAAIAIENAQLFEAEHFARKQAESLQQIGALLTTHLELNEVFERLFDLLARVVTYDSVSVQLIDKDGSMDLVAGRGFPDMDEARRVVRGIQKIGTNKQRHWAEGRPLVIPDTHAESDWMIAPGVEYIRSWVGAPLLVKGELIGVLNVDSRSAGAYDQETGKTVMAFANQAAIAIKNARLFDAFVNEQQHTALLYHLSLELSTNLKSENVANRALQAAADALGVTRGNILTLEDDDEHLQILAVTGYDRETIEALNQRLNWTISQGVTGRVVRTRMATTIPDVSQDADWIPISGLDDWVRSILSVPLVAGNRVIGALNLLSEQLGFFKTKSLSLITAIASPVALALQNARLYEGLRQRFKELEILADTSSALRKAQSYNDIPPILLAKAVEGLKADAGVLLLLENNALIFSAIHGETNVKTGDTCPQDAGMMWQALESGKPIFIPDVTQIEDLHKSAVCQALMGDALSCVCIPLRTNTSAIGVVYLNWKKKTFLSADESRLLESLAEIAANAIHRSTLHLQTVQQAQDITLAYDATIEGWSRALDLRDRETEGHSQRVTNLTLQLAQALGVNESELEHIRRGALLHDIGKMGVPDNILRKAGALSEEEWALMHRHPQLAHEMLFPIAYLQPALDIPYCHHEKWDGSGYPRGLKGEEIPLAARIFAVVDVFDALTSDRPYRPAWTKRKATAHIRQQSGIHFDPKVLRVFLKLIGRK